MFLRIGVLWKRVAPIGFFLIADDKNLVTAVRFQLTNGVFVKDGFRLMAVSNPSWGESGRRRQGWQLQGGVLKSV